MINRFDENGDWIIDMPSKWPSGEIADIAEEKPDGALIVWSFYEEKYKRIQQRIKDKMLDRILMKDINGNISWTSNGISSWIK